MRWQRCRWVGGQSKWPIRLASTCTQYGKSGIAKGHGHQAPIWSLEWSVRSMWTPSSLRASLAITDFGISYELLPDEKKTDEELQSKSGVSIKTKVAGTNDAAFPGVPQGKAAFRADFAREGAFVLRAAGVRYVRMREQQRIWQEVAAAKLSGRMSADSVVVSEVAVADRGTLVIASDRNASVVLSGDAKGGQSLDFGGRMALESYDRLYQKVTGQEGITFLYLLLRPTPLQSGSDGEPSLDVVHAARVEVPPGTNGKMASALSELDNGKTAPENGTH